jgi:hypothetical protein
MAAADPSTISAMKGFLTKLSFSAIPGDQRYPVSMQPAV